MLNKAGPSVRSVDPIVSPLRYVATVLVCMPLAILGASCARELPGETPPPQSLYYPLGIAASPASADPMLYVVSSNFDQRFNAGWIGAIDLGAALAAAEATPDRTVSTAEVVRAQVNTPALGGRLVVDADEALLMTVFRGHLGLGLIDVEREDEAVTLRCAVEGGALVERCDGEDLVLFDPDDFASDDPTSTAPSQVSSRALDDPFALSLFERPIPGGGSSLTAAVGFLSSGWLGFFDVSGVGEMPTASLSRSLFLGTLGTGFLTVHPASAQPGMPIYLGATNQGGVQGSRLFNITLQEPDEGEDRTTSFPLDDAVGGIEVPSLVFNGDGSLAFAGTRFPDAVLVLDAGLVDVLVDNADGSVESVTRPRYDVLETVPLSGRPFGMAYASHSDTDGVLAVANFDDDAIEVFMMAGARVQVSRRIDGVGRGPFELQFVSYQGRTLLITTAFFDHSITVLDLSSANPNDFEVVARIVNNDPDIEPAQRVRL